VGSRKSDANVQRGKFRRGDGGWSTVATGESRLVALSLLPPLEYGTRVSVSLQN